MLKRLHALFEGKSAQEVDCAERVRLATCALLLETAGADDEFSPGECERILDILKKHFNLSQDEAEELVVLMQVEPLSASGASLSAEMINSCCTTGEKRQILEEVWRVVYADGTLDSHEEYIARGLAALLSLTPEELEDARIRAKSDADS